MEYGAFDYSGSSLCRQTICDWGLIGTNYLRLAFDKMIFGFPGLF